MKTVVKSPLRENAQNCGFCFLEYDCRMSALNAKRLLDRGNLCGRQMFVDWAERRNQITGSDLEDNKTLFINNLPKETTEQQIVETLSPYGSIEKVTKIKDYAFVLFAEQQAAMDAMNGAEKSKLGSDAVEITLAMPKTTKNRNRFASLSHRRSRFNSHRTNSYNQYRSTFGSIAKFPMRKRRKSTKKANPDAATSGMTAGQAEARSPTATPPEPIVN